MDDNKITELYLKRSETAITETEKNTVLYAAALRTIFFVITVRQKNVQMKHI